MYQPLTHGITIHYLKPSSNEQKQVPAAVHYLLFVVYLPPYSQLVLVSWCSSTHRIESQSTVMLMVSCTKQNYLFNLIVMCICGFPSWSTLCFMCRSLQRITKFIVLLLWLGGLPPQPLPQPLPRFWWAPGPGLLPISLYGPAIEPWSAVVLVFRPRQHATVRPFVNENCVFVILCCLGLFL